MVVDGGSLEGEVVVVVEERVYLVGGEGDAIVEVECEDGRGT